jgi:hypothetical protein
MANLSIVVCGAPLSARAAELCDQARERGWDASLVVTEAALAWVDAPSIDFRSPDAPKPPRPDAVIVAPMTFNTATKWALGIADTYPLSLLAESLGAGKPIVAVPFVNENLWGHPSWQGTLATLQGAGVVLLDANNQRSRTPSALASGSGDSIAQAFELSSLVEALPSLG